MNLRRFLLPACLLFLFSSLCTYVAQAQTAEVATNDEPATFQSGVNLVSIPVVVRDSKGVVIQDLKKEDFQLFDRGKPQVIARFIVQKPGAPPVIPAGDKELETVAGGKPEEPAPPGTIASRYTAYLFDDVHLSFTDLAQVRDAAIKHLDTALTPADRAAIFTTSGQTTVDFTDDHMALRETLLRMRPHPAGAQSSITECPDINFYMADQMENKNDPTAIAIATAETQSCNGVATGAVQLAHAAARRVLESGKYETRLSFITLRALIQRMSVMPGQRSILFASPGFLVPDELRSEESDVMDRAVHANIVLSALDARGLYTIDPLGDIAHPVSAAIAPQKAMYEIQNATVTADVMAELAYGTGGSFFQNNNDLLAGFRKLTATPEAIYILYFSPQNLKLDGSFHSVKIKLTGERRLELQARRGYFAPKHMETVEDSAKEQIRDMVFSREELPNAGVDLQTQFFKISDTSSNLSVVTHLVLKQLAFRKLDGRNANEVTVVSALFDRNGNFIKAAEKIVKLRLRDQTLERVPRITVKTEFDVPPGAYVVRLVVRDTDGKMMVAENGSVQIPY